MDGMGQSHSCNYHLAQRIQVHFALSKSLSQCTEEPGESAYKVTDSLLWNIFLSGKVCEITKNINKELFLRDREVFQHDFSYYSGNLSREICLMKQIDSAFTIPLYSQFPGDSAES